MAQPFQLIGKVMQKRAANFAVASAQVARTAGSVIGREVATDTPVDTGAARSNWIMTIDEIATYTIPPYVPYIKTHSEDYARRASDRAVGVKHVLGTGDKEERANLAAVLAQHFAALQRFDPVQNKTIYIANNLPYMERLNAGYSPQTEAGFVERAVELGVVAIRRMKLMGGD
jgi:hypothetical protein